MKKFCYLIMACAIVCLAGCRQENMSKTYKGREIRGARIESVSTKCEETSPDAGELICQMPVTIEDKQAYLSVYVSDMDNEYDVSSKSVEITTGSIKSMPFAMKVFNSNGTVYTSSDEDLEDPQTASMENVILTYDSGDNVWKFDRDYYWPLDGKALTFCSFAPDSTLVGEVPSVTDVKIASGKLKLNYTQPYAKQTDKFGSIDDALVENDLLVAMVTQSAGSDGIVNVKFKHALTGVRFECGDLRDLPISAMALEGFFESGTMTLDPAGNDGKGLITWDCTGSERRNFRQSFLVDGAEFVAAKNSSLDPTEGKPRTFFMIPQKLDLEKTSFVLETAGNIHESRIKMKDLNTTNVGGSTDGKKEENIQKILDWRNYSGRIITFRLSLASNYNMVNVSVKDEVEGLLKHNIVIMNEGETPVFIRETLVGNWLNGDNKILAAWNEKDPYGKFTSNSKGNLDFNDKTTLPGNWLWKTSGKQEDEGIYYYKYYIKPKEVLKQNLFDTFTVTKKPVSNSGSWEGNVAMQISKLELNVLVQAVSAVTVSDDGKWTYSDVTLAHAKEAWGNDIPGILMEEDK